MYSWELIVYRWEAFFLISARIFSGMLLCMRFRELRCVQVLIRDTMFLPPSLRSRLRSGKRERECVRESVCVSAWEREKRKERERESERASEKKNERAKRDWETHIHLYTRIHANMNPLEFLPVQNPCPIQTSTQYLWNTENREISENQKNFKQVHTHAEEKRRPLQDSVSTI